MNLITGFSGVPWLFFFMKQFGLRFAFLAFCLSGFCLSVQENIGWLFGLGDRAVEVVYKLFLVLIFLGPSCVLVLYGFCYCFCYSRCRAL